MSQLAEHVPTGHPKKGQSLLQTRNNNLKQKIIKSTYNQLLDNKISNQFFYDEIWILTYDRSRELSLIINILIH